MLWYIWQWHMAVWVTEYTDTHVAIAPISRSSWYPYDIGGES